jgi:hypothetical protein
MDPNYEQVIREECSFFAETTLNNIRRLYSSLPPLEELTQEYVKARTFKVNQE